MLTSPPRRPRPALYPPSWPLPTLSSYANHPSTTSDLLRQTSSPQIIADLWPKLQSRSHNSCSAAWNQDLQHDLMAKEKPSKAAKECLSRLLQQEIIEIGKVAKTLCQRSGSREVSIHRNSKNKLFELEIWVVSVWVSCITCCRDKHTMYFL